MDLIFSLLSKTFTFLVLKPADFLLFGGSGVLWRPREYWTEGMQENLQKKYEQMTPDQRAAFLASPDPVFVVADNDEPDCMDPSPTVANVVDPTWRFFWDREDLDL